MFVIKASDLFISLIACICVFLLGLYAYVTRNYDYWKKLGVKHLKPTFPFGNLGPCIFLQKGFHEFLDEVYQKTKGEKMFGFYFFDKPYLLLRDPELLRDVFIKDFNIFSNKLMVGNEYDDFGKHTLFISENPPWKHVRQRMTPMFTSGKLKKNFELMLKIYEDFDNHLKNLGVNDKVEKPIEVKELCAKLMTDVIGITAYNVRFNALSDPRSKFRAFGKAIVDTNLMRYLKFSAILVVPPLRHICRPKFFDAGTEFFKNTFSEIIEERIQSGVKRSDFVDLVIENLQNNATNKEDNFKVDDVVWISQLAGIFSAGFETSSTTTSFAIYELTRHPDIQKKLRTELEEALKKTNGNLTYEMVTTLPYLDMVVRETLRMYPILPMIDRVATEDYTFKGTNVTIKKDIPVVYPMRLMQVDPEFHVDPHEFKPERFSEENKNNIGSFVYSPFGEGPRNCIGGRQGLLQTKLAVAYIISNYELSMCKQTPVSLKIAKLNILLHASGDLYINMKKLTK